MSCLHQDAITCHSPWWYTAHSFCPPFTKCGLYWKRSFVFASVRPAKRSNCRVHFNLTCLERCSKKDFHVFISIFQHLTAGLLYNDYGSDCIVPTWFENVPPCLQAWGQPNAQTAEFIFTSRVLRDAQRGIFMSSSPFSNTFFAAKPRWYFVKIEMRSKATPFRATLRQGYSYLTLIAKTEKIVKIRKIKGGSLK